MMTAKESDFKTLRLVMMGTGRFALPAFLGLYETPHEVAALFTQPDRRGRGHHRHPHPLKDAALERGTPVFQPENVNSPDSLSSLRDLQADVFVVAAYGQILSAELLALPVWGSFNLHASLLPKYRGAAPIQYAVLNGEQETGVTVFRIEPELDAGPVLAVGSIPIGPDDTSGDLEPRLADVGQDLTREVLEQIACGNCRGTAQPTTGVTRAPKIRKADGAIPWEKSAADVHNHIRAMQPWPGGFTHLPLANPEKPWIRAMITRTRLAETAEFADGQAGCLLPSDDERLLVQTGSGGIEVLNIKPDGKREMTAADFLRGHALAIGQACRKNVEMA